MPRALIISTIGRTIEAFLLPMAQRLRATGWDVHAAASGATGSPTLTREFDGVHDLHWQRNPADIGGILSSVHALRSLNEEFRFDVIHVHTPVAAFFGRLALRRRGSAAQQRIIYTAHGFHFYRGQRLLPYTLYSSAERLGSKWTDYLVTMNQEDYDAARNFNSISTDRVRLIHGVGVDTAFYSQEAVAASAVDSVRKTAGISPNAPVFLMIAELIARKRPTEVIAAFRPVAEATEAHLMIAGDGPLTAKCRLLSESSGIANRVHLLGKLADVRPYIAASQAVVLFSHHEGLPRSIMESLSMGTPVIGSNIRGISDLIGHEAGWLVPSGDESALTRAMLEAIDKPSAAINKGYSGRDLMCGLYSVDKVVDGYVNLYNEALGPQ